MAGFITTIKYNPNYPIAPIKIEGCPCNYIAPCRVDCRCAYAHLSEGGCDNCCSWDYDVYKKALYLDNCRRVAEGLLEHTKELIGKGEIEMPNTPSVVSGEELEEHNKSKNIEKWKNWN